ncbi:helix-turn-helix transcriptional regulator, partial [Kingella kingae]
MSFNERVKNRRLELGLSQAALGKLAGVPQSTIGQIENGRNKSSTKILELAHALQTTVEYLVDGVEPAQKQPSL